MDTTFESVIVNKPWGYEYLCYRNPNLAIWLLFLAHDQETSLHCHPKKNTGLFVVSGEVKVSFLRGSTTLISPSKINIMRARFHSTKATSPQGAFVLEIEAPEDKDDLVRIEDRYGRAHTAYEDERFHFEKPEHYHWFSDPVANPEIQTLHGLNFRHLLLANGSQLESVPIQNFYVFTCGGLQASKGELIVAPGDILDATTLNRLMEHFDFKKNTSLIEISPKN